jgi:hypothetical protein
MSELKVTTLEANNVVVNNQINSGDVSINTSVYGGKGGETLNAGNLRDDNALGGGGGANTTGGGNGARGEVRVWVIK